MADDEGSDDEGAFGTSQLRVHVLVVAPRGDANTSRGGGGAVGGACGGGGDCDAAGGASDCGDCGDNSARGGDRGNDDGGDSAGSRDDCDDHASVGDRGGYDGYHGCVRDDANGVSVLWLGKDSVVKKLFETTHLEVI